MNSSQPPQLFFSWQLGASIGPMDVPGQSRFGFVLSLEEDDRVHGARPVLELFLFAVVVAIGWQLRGDIDPDRGRSLQPLIDRLKASLGRTRRVGLTLWAFALTNALFTVFVPGRFWWANLLSGLFTAWIGTSYCGDWFRTRRRIESLEARQLLERGESLTTAGAIR